MAIDAEMNSAALRMAVSEDVVHCFGRDADDFARSAHGGVMIVPSRSVAPGTRQSITPLSEGSVQTK